MEFKTLQQDMVAAMKAHDKTTKDAISSLIAAVKKAAIDAGVRENIPSDLCDKIILKEIKSVKEQIDTCPDTRPELKKEYEDRYNIISKYAPKLLSEDEVKAILERDFADVIATKNKGMIMKTVMAALNGKAEGKVISSAVAKLIG